MTDRPFVIRVLGFPNGAPCSIAGEYVQHYNPTVRATSTTYPTGDLVTTRDIAKAMHFVDVDQARHFWQQPFGSRPDGELNRPLTTFTVEIVRDGKPTSRRKNPNAVALGKLGGRKGGLARAAKLSDERRSEIARKAAQVKWGRR
jgi:hypothetical protein